MARPVIAHPTAATATAKPGVGAAAAGGGLKPGERVQLRGRKSKDESGTPTFEATKLVKRLRTYGAEPTVASTEPRFALT